MTTYNSYEAAKIANPDKEILTDCKKVEFTAELGLNYYHKCNPADHCMTVEKFLADGYKFVEGDMFLNSENEDVEVGKEYENGIIITEHEANKPCKSVDAECYILRAASLEEKKKRTKVEYMKCEFVTKWEHVRLMEDTGESLFFSPNGEFIEVMTQESAIRKLRNGHELYRRIETPMTEREAFIGAACNVNEEIHGERRQYLIESLFDSGLFKLVN